ncbi:MAG: tetratricopeptide repeat protein [Parashewanella sp.]
MNTLSLATKLFASSMILSSSVFAETTEESLAQIDAASNRLNISALKELSQTHTDYEQAYANYRLAIAENLSGNRTQAKASLNDAATTLENLNQTQNSAENYALLSAVYGMSIALSPMKGMTLGPKADKAINQAQALAPNNPRVYLVKAIAAFNTPKMFGGSKQKALDFSNKAIDLFSTPCSHICWGQAEAYTWRGLTKQNEGDIQGAISDWKQALTIEPTYGWAKFLIQQNQ